MIFVSASIFATSACCTKRTTGYERQRFGVPDLRSGSRTTETKKNPPPPGHSRKWEDWELPCYLHQLPNHLHHLILNETRT
ncbi:unnamed protein product [Linum trigynum]|uniref:Secreted protein n=1 Tax=Linum trigynum TaxID=586398 RepID=A0AAV2G7U9_9ROSI